LIAFVYQIDNVEFTTLYRQLAGRVAAQLYWQGEVIPGDIAFRAL